MVKAHPIDRLYRTIASRKKGDPKKSYTAKLFREGIPKCAKKLGEESVEAAIAAVMRDKRALVSESADVLYHLLVLWAALGIKPEKIYAELARRESMSGIDEKASRAT